MTAVEWQYVNVNGGWYQMQNRNIVRVCRNRLSWLFGDNQLCQLHLSVAQQLYLHCGADAIGTEEGPKCLRSGCTGAIQRQQHVANPHPGHGGGAAFRDADDQTPRTLSGEGCEPFGYHDRL